MNYVGIKFTLPKPEGKVDARELAIVVNGGSAQIVTLPGSATVSEEIVFADTDIYSVTLTDIDEHGTRSQPSAALHGSAAEDMRPAQPAAPGPVADTNVMTEQEGLEAKAAAQKKAQSEAKAEQAKAAKEAEAEAEAKAARDKEAAHAAKKKPAPAHQPSHHSASK